MEEFFSDGLTKTEDIARILAPRIKENGFLALYGDMGAGKTAFVRGLVKALCPECLELVHSPTFAIVNEYDGDEVKIRHFDLYRLKDEDDLYSTGFYDCIDAGFLVITEWSENFCSEIPKNAISLKIEKLSESKRRFMIC